MHFGIIEFPCGFKVNIEIHLIELIHGLSEISEILE